MPEPIRGFDIGPGQAYVIEPGHDAWVVGGEGVVAFEFEQHAAETYARNKLERQALF